MTHKERIKLATFKEISPNERITMMWTLQCDYCGKQFGWVTEEGDERYACEDCHKKALEEA